MNLPTSHSLFAAAGLVDVLKEAYGFPDVQCELFMLARGDIYYVVTPQQRFVLRIYHAALHTRGIILSEVVLLDYLHQHGLSVAHPLRRLDGEWLLTFQASEGTRYGALYTFAEGESISANTELEAIVRYGELVARVHAAADSIPFPLERPLAFGCVC